MVKMQALIYIALSHIIASRHRASAFLVRGSVGSRIFYFWRFVMKVTYKYLFELYTMIELININMKIAKKQLDKATRLIKKNADEKHPLDSPEIPDSKYKTKLTISELDCIQIKNQIARAFAQVDGCVNQMAQLVLAAEAEPQNFDFPTNEYLLKKVYEKAEENK